MFDIQNKYIKLISNGFQPKLNNIGMGGVKLFFSLFIVCLLVNKSSFAQSPDLNKKITIIVKDSSLSAVLEQISEKGNINFFFSNEKILTDQKVTLTAKNKSIRSILDKISKDLKLEYQIVEKQVVLKPRRASFKSRRSESSKKEIKRYTISGYIKDDESGELMIGATVWVKELKTGSSTNSYGFYSITLPEGNYNLEFSFWATKIFTKT
ncbi:MAG: carboxypeptidase-like regulatory domain-containing protein [Bacteroidia bacterium]|nr:carboxypeptidase-like regulatory domain-containing protein [Bacteroidia bacterium]